MGTRGDEGGRALERPIESTAIAARSGGPRVRDDKLNLSGPRPSLRGQTRLSATQTIKAGPQAGQLD